MLEKIYGLADFTAAALLVFGGAPAPAAVLYFFAVVLALKGALSFIPIPLYMPSLLMCGTDIAAALLLLFAEIFLPLKAAVIFILLLKAVPGLAFSLLGK